jgi:hypothetical protein
MGDRFKKAQAGQPLEVSATAWNAFIDAAQKTKNAQHDELSDAATQFRPADIIKLRNESGIDLPRFSVLGISAPIFAPSVSLRAFQDQVALTGVVPTESDHFGRFAILLDPVRNGHIARAWVSGACQARVNVEDDDHTCADVTDGDPTKLTSAKRGAAQLLWREGGTGDQWAIVRFGAICFGSNEASGPLSRCDCPEDSYEVATKCVPCGAYGRKMPTYWWLEVLESDANPYAESECETPCATIPTLVKLKNETDAYGNPLCLWTGSSTCFSFELSQSGDYYYIRIWDRFDCLLTTLRKHVDTFNCCGENEDWELVDGSVCIVQILLRPHECTCCDEEPCPPPGEPLCDDTDCCVQNCTITATVSNLYTPPPLPCTLFDDPCFTIDGDPCPFPVGDPGRLGCYKSFPSPPESCGGMNGVYSLTWTKNCTWRFRGIPSGIGSTMVEALLTLSGRVWTLRLEGENGQVAVFHSVDWECGFPVLMEFSASESTCPASSPAPEAILLSV